MKLHRTIVLGLLSTFMIGGLTLSASSAGFEYCFPLQNGEELCFPIPVEEVKIKIPRDPGPKTPVGIGEIAPVLQSILGSESTQWIVADSLGERAFMMDLRAMEIYELEDIAGPGH